MSPLPPKLPPYLLLLLPPLLLHLSTLQATSSLSKSTTGRCIKQIIGTQQQTDEFIKQYFQQKPILLNNTLLHPTHLDAAVNYPTLNIFNISYLSFITRSFDLKTGDSLQIYKDGIILDAADEPLTPYLLDVGLMESAALLFKNIYRYHPALYDWARCLQNDLTLPVELDIWVHPPLSTGKYPHAKFEDLLLVQMAGVIHIDICDQIKLPEAMSEDEAMRFTRFTEEYITNSGRCHQHTLTPNTAVYIPLGYIHFATTPDSEDLSITHAWHITRIGLTFFHFIESLTSTASQFAQLAVHLKSIQKEYKELDYVVDTDVIADSVDNEDTPKGWLDALRMKVVTFFEDLQQREDAVDFVPIIDGGAKRVVSRGELLQEFVSTIRSNKQIVADAIIALRLQIAISYLASYPQELTDIKNWRVEGRDKYGGITTTTKLIRTPGVYVSLDNKHEAAVVNGELLHLPSEQEMKGYRYCLGSFDVSTARGRVFEVNDIPVNNTDMKKWIGRVLLRSGGVSIATAEDIHTVGMVARQDGSTNQSEL